MMTGEIRCDCVVKNRRDGETEREWLKRWMCMWHWMETDYYQSKLEYNRFLIEVKPNDNPSTDV